MIACRHGCLPCGRSSFYRCRIFTAGARDNRTAVYWCYPSRCAHQDYSAVPDNNDEVETISRLQSPAGRSNWYFFGVESLTDGVWKVHCEARISASYEPLIAGKPRECFSTHTAVIQQALVRCFRSSRLLLWQDIPPIPVHPNGSKCPSRDWEHQCHRQLWRHGGRISLSHSSVNH